MNRTLRRPMPLIAMSALAATTGLLTSVSVAPTASASSSSVRTCLPTYNAYSNMTVARAENCYRAQARIDRYEGTRVVVYLGPRASISTVRAYGGYNAGNFWRAQAGSGSTWTPWRLI